MVAAVRVHWQRDMRRWAKRHCWQARAWWLHTVRAGPPLGFVPFATRLNEIPFLFPRLFELIQTFEIHIYLNGSPKFMKPDLLDS
jgi:hypothetical protein